MAKSSNYQKYFETTQRKLLSAYGGPGSLVEITQYSIRIADLSDWPYIKYEEHRKPAPIRNENLLHWLRQSFHNLEKLYPLPENSLDENHYPNEWHNLLGMAYPFPAWFYCTRCKRFDKATNWFEEWRRRAKEIKKGYFELKGLQLQECPHCHRKNNSGHLEQVRFVLASEQGQLADLPWDKWILTKYQGAEGEDEIFEPLNMKLRLKDRQLRYVSGGTDTDFGSIRIELHQNAASKRPLFSLPLRGLTNLRFRPSLFPSATGVNEYHAEEGAASMKVMMRTSQSLYYPQVASSIYFPPKPGGEQPKTEKITLSDDEIELLNDLFPLPDERIKKHIPIKVEQIAKLRQRYEAGEDLPNQLAKLAEPDNDGEQEQSIAEQEFKNKELETLVKLGEEGPKKQLVDLKVQKVKPELYPEFSHLLEVYRLDTLKLHQVQVGYTRLAPPASLDSFLKNPNSSQSHLPKSAFLTKYSKHEKYLPAIEMGGEGLLFKLNEQAVMRWLDTAAEGIYERMNKNPEDLDDNATQKCKEVAARRMLHTFSHVVIKELEFMCGYPAVSLSERLYLQHPHFATLIYTCAGSEGSYGGLVGVADDQRLGHLLKNAIDRAHDCTNDPVCYNDASSSEQETASEGACYDCAILPETSCELFNRELDRAFLIDPAFGYFAQPNGHPTGASTAFQHTAATRAQ